MKKNKINIKLKTTIKKASEIYMVYTIILCTSRLITLRLVFIMLSQ